MPVEVVPPTGICGQAMVNYGSCSKPFGSANPLPCRRGGHVSRWSVPSRAPLAAAAPTVYSSFLDSAGSKRDTIYLLTVAAFLPAINEIYTPKAYATSMGVPTLPSLEVQIALDKAFKKCINKAKAPVLLRLSFHDAGTWDAAAGDGGANGSVVWELERPENKGLKRGWRVIEDLRKALQGSAAEGQVSSADLIALAGAEAVRICGGPRIPVPIGRMDSGTADARNRLPDESLSGPGLRAAFAAKGLSTQELVALSGSHTLGGKGFGDPLEFSHVYYNELLKKPWNNPNDDMAAMIGIPSDHALADDPYCLPFIQLYAQDQERFFQDFGDAYVKMMSLGAVWR